MTTDFCPWANRFVYWLKEPVGWFALATAASVVIGLYSNPIGWTLAASLTAIMITGMAWPWIAVRVTQCGLRPQVDAIHEETPCELVVSVRNRIPIPVWGLAIEGYLDCHSKNEAVPTVGLACVPPLCTADYSVVVTPKLRGHYPATEPQIACSFPFGIWTARRPLQEFKPVTVWPKVYAIAGNLPIVGQNIADQGEGCRGGRSGDFIGVRSFQRGDSAKHVNWVASARSDSLIVTERGGPQSAEIDVIIDIQRHATREAFARRIRIAASILASFHQTRVQASVQLGDQRFALRLNTFDRRQMLDALASVPIDGSICQPIAAASNRARIVVTGSESGDAVIQIDNPTGGRRAGGSSRRIVVRPSEDLALAMSNLWKEVRDADVAA